MTTNIEQLERLLEYSFADKSLLLKSLTHPSYFHEANGSSVGDYQRPEFLGDAVLGLLLAEMLYYQYPDWDEGALSQLRSRLAGQDVLADRARFLGIGEFILLGRGEKYSAGREKDSILSDVLEAVIAALYLDSGLDEARTFVVRLFNQLVSQPDLIALGRDSKSELQEFLSANGYSQPEYRLVRESGPPHDPIFNFEIVVGDRVIGVGEGKSKKIAQQSAAEKALGFLISDIAESV